MTMYNIYEDEKWKVEGTVKTGDMDGKQVKLIIRKGAKNEKDETVTIAGGKAKHEFPVPTVPANEANYTLSLFAEYAKFTGDKAEELTDKCTVWPKTFKVIAKDASGAKVQGFTFTAKQGATDLAPSPATDDKGEREFTLNKESGAVAIAAAPPYEILEDKRDPNVLRVANLKVKRNFVPEFINPRPKTDGSSHKQYVNLASAASGRDFMGAEVEIEVGVKDNKGKKDDIIHIQAEFSRASKRNDPLPELVGATEKPSDKLHKGQVKLTADNAKVKFTVKLGLAGGDTCTIRLSSVKDSFSDGPGVPVLKFENWRKLWYQIRYPAVMDARLGGTSTNRDLPTAIKTQFKSILDSVFVEYELSAAHEIADADATQDKMNGMIMSASFWGTTDKVYLASWDWLLDPTKGFTDDTKKDKTVFVSLCDRLVSSVATANALAITATGANLTWNYPNLLVIGVGQHVDVTGFDWVADINPTALAPQPTTLAFDPDPPPYETGAADGKVTIQETRRTGNPSKDISFAPKSGGYETALSAAAKTDIKTYLVGLINDEPGLRECGNQITLKLISKKGGDHDTRWQAVKHEIETVFANPKGAGPVKIKYHPGLDKNGNPRRGSMVAAWITVTSQTHFKTDLPKSPGGTPAHQKTLPGDFVGAAVTATECPVKLKFTLNTYAGLGGQAGGGFQILVISSNAGVDGDTVCHELAHLMGMCPVPSYENDLLPPGLTAKTVDDVVSGKRANFYTDTGIDKADLANTAKDGRRNIHRGGHCAEGLSEAAKADPALSDTPGSSSSCVMYGQQGSAARTFCDACKELIKARRLEDIRKPWTTTDRTASGG
jgi:hypothetical protein